MQKLANLLEPIDIQLNQLLLDPNNPRFSDLEQDFMVVNETRFPDQKVQEQTFEKMKDQRFDVMELRDTIKSVGYLPIDRIVVRRWRGKKKNTELYIVIEGNRRVAALKWLIELNEGGKQDLTKEQIKNFEELGALLLDDEKAAAEALFIIPGLRHV